MGGTTTSAGATRATSRGRIDKRQAILDAAFTVFADRGYARAGVEEIAEVAGVAKHTVYNHLGDKENVFHAAMEATGNAVMAENVAAAEHLAMDGAADPDAVRSRLEDVANRLLVQCCDPRSWALRRLLNAESASFPDLLESVWGHGADRLRQTLADRMARLSLAGVLRTCDPVEAAEQFLALLTGPMEARSQFGTRPVPEAELRGVVNAAVSTFLRAFQSDHLSATASAAAS
ncbi:TetR/AcrR family transcriptional regulator [Actinacidiphila acididurans]|uniref:TetR/AcrR family transcriptional regulator n=1 Tax=Actinacidiphila acididurans TaxID=2784346 RepID=A0ABS2TJE3_9ACTN|nr:TetR/AcrR family transcriptional regulator [Actinacidiphila acididurans]MBM9503464.1 TetR/AcrR family transcriptional regulator [Actinacidiphila acididurans]